MTELEHKNAAKAVTCTQPTRILAQPITRGVEITDNEGYLIKSVPNPTAGNMAEIVHHLTALPSDLKNEGFSHEERVRMAVRMCNYLLTGQMVE